MNAKNIFTWGAMALGAAFVAACGGGTETVVVREPAQQPATTVVTTPNQPGTTVVQPAPAPASPPVHQEIEVDD